MNRLSITTKHCISASISKLGNGTRKMDRFVREGITRNISKREVSNKKGELIKNI